MVYLSVFALFYSFGFLKKTINKNVPTTSATPTATPEKPKESTKKKSFLLIPDSLQEQNKQSKTNALTTTGSELYSFLFSKDFTEKSLNSEDFLYLQKRFAEPYSQVVRNHYSLADREAVSRMGLLKAWADHPSVLQKAALKQQVAVFFEQVSLDPKENILVRRQALRSLVKLTKGSDEKNAYKKAARQDRRIRSMASLSDQEILEVILEK